MAAGKSLTAELAGKIRKDILTEALSPGVKLTEQNICDQYGVSRTPVREALRNLEAEGLIEIIPNRGAFVIGFSGEDMADLFALRKIYEVQAVQWAILRITETEMEDLEESYEFMDFYTKRGDTRRMKELNARFHRSIYEASHNRLLCSVLTSYQSYLRDSARTLPYREEQLDEIFREHTAIFEAFHREDPASGGQAMACHIENSAVRALDPPLSMVSGGSGAAKL
jgi:DNA-binding GntR family transcriptional regulator